MYKYKCNTRIIIIQYKPLMQLQIHKGRPMQATHLVIYTLLRVIMAPWADRVRTPHSVGGGASRGHQGH